MTGREAYLGQCQCDSLLFGDWTLGLGEIKADDATVDGAIHARVLEIIWILYAYMYLFVQTLVHIHLAVSKRQDVSGLSKKARNFWNQDKDKQNLGA